MEQLKAHHSPYEVLDHLEQAHIGLARDPDTRHLSAQAETHADAIEAKLKALRQAKARRVVATAWVEDADDKLDQSWMKLVRFVLALTNGNREHPTYKTLYPKQAPHESVKPTGGPEQAREVARVVALLRTDPTLAEVAGHADTLVQDQEALDAEVTGREALYQGEAVAQADLNRELDAGRQFYNSLERKLLEIYGDDKRKVRRALGA